MSDLTPYEKKLAEELNKLPLPNEDAAWEDMSKLLDESGDKGALPPSGSTIVLASLLIAMLIGLLWLLVSRHIAVNDKSINNKQQTGTSQAIKGNQGIDQQQSTASSETGGTKDQLPTGTNTGGSPVNVTDDIQTADNTAQSQSSDNTTSLSNNKNQSTNKGVNTIGTNSSKTGNDQSTKNNSQNINGQITNTSEITNNQNNGKKNTTMTNANNSQNNNSQINDNTTATNQANSKKVVLTNEVINTHSTTSMNITAAKEDDENGKKSTGTKTQYQNNSDREIANNDIDVVVNHNDAINEKTSSKNKSNIATKSHVKTTAALSTAHALNHSKAVKSGTQKLVHKNNALHNNYTTANAHGSKTTHSHSAVPAYYAQSTASTSTKNGKSNFKKKNNNVATTKQKTHVSIATPAAESDEEIIDTAQLIKIGEEVVAKKKARQDLIKKKDSIAAKALVVAPIATDTTAKKKENKHLWDISVGIAEQQPIRLTCDCVYPNDAYTQPLVTDYIPSVYVKIQPSKKWFVEAEFKYKAPQYIQEQLYQKSIHDVPLDYVISTSVLKKVYYNQLPVSFDYYIIPHLSVGAGLIYNNFAGSAVQHDVTKTLYGNAGDSLISSTTVSSKKDSLLSFTQNSFQGLLQAQYDWKHFCFGARYAIGLQTYLKYNEPIFGDPVQKKNNALTVFIRFELWDSKKKK